MVAQNKTDASQVVVGRESRVGGNNYRFRIVVAAPYKFRQLAVGYVKRSSRRVYSLDPGVRDAGREADTTASYTTGDNIMKP
jgi:hypothetical protein